MFIYLDVQDFDLWTSPISMPLFHPFVTDFNESGLDHMAGKLASPQSPIYCAGYSQVSLPVSEVDCLCPVRNDTPSVFHVSRNSRIVL